MDALADARRQLRVLQDALADLRRYREGVPKDKVLGDTHIQRMVSHALYAAAQAAVDLAIRWGDAHGLPQARDYHDAFPLLAHERLIPEVLARKLSRWRGFRHLLAPSTYAIVDYEKVYATLRHTKDLEAFATAAARKLG